MFFLVGKTFNSNSVIFLGKLLWSQNPMKDCFLLFSWDEFFNNFFTGTILSLAVILATFFVFSFYVCGSCIWLMVQHFLVGNFSFISMSIIGTFLAPSLSVSFLEVLPRVLSYCSCNTFLWSLLQLDGKTFVDSQFVFMQ